MADLQRLASTTDPARSALYRRDGDDGAIDLGTWFNAAPVGWWRALLGPVEVQVRVLGRGTATLLVADPGGPGRVVASAELDGPQVLTVPAGAAWAWLRVTPGPAGASVDAADWTVETAVDVAPVTVVVPTFRFEEAALAQARRLLGAAFDGVVGRLVLVDQGGEPGHGTVRGHPGFAEVAAAAGERLVLVEQGNLGGSGGYARGMVESLRWPGSPVLLHDDDAEIDAEVLRRVATLSALTTSRGTPTVFGTALLAAEAPTSLEALAERVPPRTFQWGPADGLEPGRPDLAGGTPADWSFTTPADVATYAGWWGALLPVGAVETVGLPAPYFLKWDDAEHGLRAGDRGLRVATLPGTGVWHPTWAAKGTIASWSAMPMHRNRVATALARGAGRGVVLDSLVHQLKHLLSLQYATADLWDAGLAEVLGGPAWLAADLTAVRPRAQAVLDAAGSRRAEPRPGGRGVRRLPRPAAFTWRAGLGRAAVVFDDGSPAMVRDVPRAARSAARTLGRHARLAVRWRALSREYGAALTRAASREAWEERFAGQVRAAGGADRSALAHG